MKVLLAHNYYQQPGGEDQVFLAEGTLLEDHGHDVVRYVSHNDEINHLTRFSLAKKTIWNFTSYVDLLNLMRKDVPDIIHVHNTLPLISPSIYDAAWKLDIPVVQTLHNYRNLCPAATLYRDGHICNDCIGKTLPWPAVWHGCYRQNRFQTAGITAKLMVHKIKGTYKDKITQYICMTRFSRDKYVEGGFPPDKISVKPHFLSRDPGPGDGKGDFALFVGRLAPEKGVSTLLDAWEIMDGLMPLKVIGDGPMAPYVKEKTNGMKQVDWLGQCSKDTVLHLMGKASVLIVPSDCYETFGLVVIEAFSNGTPVIVSDIGSLAELVDHQRTGLKFIPGNADDLAVKVKWLLSNQSMQAQMRTNARAEFEAKYTSEINYYELIGIYKKAIEENRRKKKPAKTK
ncbi:MAG: glycosyltransferase family 4 protein [Balneolales bacterium]